MKMNVRFTRDEYDHFIDIITGTCFVEKGE